MPDPLKIFIAYAHKDEEFLNELWEHFMHFERSQIAVIWYDGKIEPGAEWKQDIKDNMNHADIIFLLVSSSSIASDYFFDKEVKDALELHKNGAAQVVPFIIRPCDWQTTALGALKALPKNEIAVSLWENRDLAYKEAVDWIWKIIEKRKVGSIEKEEIYEPKNQINYIHSVIVDDEVNCITELENLIKMYCPEIKIINTFQSSEEAYLYVKENKPDLLFLDIRMPYLNGLDLLAKLGCNDYNCIFVTASADYMLDGLRLNAIDYLIKGFDHVELLDAIGRAKERFKIKDTLDHIELNNYYHKPFRIDIEDSRVRLVKLYETSYFKASIDNTVVGLIDQSLTESIEPHKIFKKRLSKQFFFKCNKRYIINMYQRDNWDEDNFEYVKMVCGEVIQISPKKRDEFRDFKMKFE